MTTRICVEALAAGVYPIHIKSSYSIDCDILDSLPKDMHSSLKTEEELLSILKKIHEMTEDESYKMKTAAKDIVEDFFSPINDSLFELFVKNIKK
jgi:hypothetical protein